MALGRMVYESAGASSELIQLLLRYIQRASHGNMDDGNRNVLRRGGVKEKGHGWQADGPSSSPETQQDLHSSVNGSLSHKQRLRFASEPVSTAGTRGSPLR